MRTIQACSGDQFRSGCMELGLRQGQSRSRQAMTNRYRLSIYIKTYTLSVRADLVTRQWPFEVILARGAHLRSVEGQWFGSSHCDRVDGATIVSQESFIRGRARHYDAISHLSEEIGKACSYL